MAVSYSTVQLAPRNQTFGVDIGSASYRLRTTFDAAPEGGWLLDILDANSAPIVAGIPLLPKSNLLAQYDYLGLGFGLILVNTKDPDAPPAFSELGVTSTLYVAQIT